MLKVPGAVTAGVVATSACATAGASPLLNTLAIGPHGGMSARMSQSKRHLGAAVFAAVLATMGLSRQAAATPMDLTIDINGNSETFTDASTPNQILVSFSIGDVIVSGEFALETVNGFDELVSESFNIVNTGTGVATVSAALSGQNFVGPVGVYSASGSGTWLNSPGSSMTQSYYYDPTNTLGGKSANDTPGALLASLTSSPAGGGTSSFAMGQSGYLPVPTGPGDDFSMTEAWSYTLDGDGGSLSSRGQDEIALVPEPATLGVLGIGLFGLTLTRGRKYRV